MGQRQPNSAEAERTGSNNVKVPNVSQTPMGSGDTPSRSDFAVNAIKNPPEIDGEAVLTGSEGHDTSGQGEPRRAKLPASQNPQHSDPLILGTQNQHMSLYLSHF